MKKQRKYQHGGNPASDMAKFGLPERPVLDFSVNLNPFGAPKGIRDNWGAFQGAIENYPSVEGEGIAHYYQEKFGVSRRNVLAGNGSTELIYLVPRALNFKRVLIITPSYHDYERASRLAGADVKKFPLTSETRFSYPDVGRLVQALRHADALWLGRPNNPTGVLLEKELILKLAARFPDKWFIVDEAFIQFVDRWEDESLVFEKALQNIIIIHSLTKFYALAGLRMGGVVAEEAVVRRFRAAKEPWSVNGIADRIAPLLLECADYEQKSRAYVSEECKRLFYALETTEGVIPFPSSANFILCQWVKTNNLDDLIRHFLINGAYIRDCRNFPGLEENYFRMGLRSAGENDRLLSLISSFPDHPN